MFAQLAERNIVALKKILDQGDDGGVNSVRKLLDLYQSCLDTEQINALGAEPILQVINRTGEAKRIVGVWLWQLICSYRQCQPYKHIIKLYICTS